jgi:nitronate monooxygenase
MKFNQSQFCLDYQLDIPLIAAPMFLVSNVDLVVAASEAGAMGTFPALNYRPIEEYKNAIKQMRARTKKCIGVNIIVNKSNTRQNEDLKWALEFGVNVFITSLGSPRQVIAEAHRQGAKVFCDVTNLEHALKVQDMGADGVIAVSSGAGGHAGPISPLVLIPWLKKELKIPVIAAGGIANGTQMAACLVLGAQAVSVGTRFITSREATVGQAYKQAIINASPEDIMMTSWISGTPASIIRTEYTKDWGGDLPTWLKILKTNPWTKKYVVPLIHFMGARKLEQAVGQANWKSVWCAGQSAGLIDREMTVSEIVNEFKASLESVSL